MSRHSSVVIFRSDAGGVFLDTDRHPRLKANGEQLVLRSPQLLVSFGQEVYRIVTVVSRKLVIGELLMTKYLASEKNLKPIKAVKASPLMIRRIVAPTDLSHESQKALDYAAGLADYLGSKLTLLHVYQNPFGYEPITLETAEETRNGRTAAENALLARSWSSTWLVEDSKINMLGIALGTADV